MPIFRLEWGHAARCVARFICATLTTKHFDIFLFVRRRPIEGTAAKIAFPPTHPHAIFHSFSVRLSFVFRFGS